MAAAAWLEGCASTVRGGPSARPTATAGTVVLTFMPWWIQWQSTGKGLLQQVTSSFEDTHHGLRVKAVPGPQGGGVGSAAVLASIIAGSGPDVFADCCNSWAVYTAGDVLADLTPYLQRDNVPLTTWSKGQVTGLSFSGRQFGLPVYDGPVVFVYRQDILDHLGLAYPDPNWTYTEAAALWAQCAGTVQSGGKTVKRYGADFRWSTSGWNGQEYLLHGFGGAELDQTHTRAGFALPGSVAAAEWVYPLLWQGVVGGFTGAVSDGTAVFQWVGEWAIPHSAAQWAQFGFPWAFVPMPKFPQGRATFGNNDFWALNAGGRHLDAAWELLKWLAAGDTWQRFCMHTALLAPSKVSLWPEFEAQLEATAPVLKNRGLHWFRDAVEQGYAYPEQFFRYQPTQALTLIGETMGRIFDRQVGIQVGLQQLTQQIDLLQAQGAQEAKTHPALTLAQERQQYAVELQGLTRMFSSGRS